MVTFRLEIVTKVAKAVGSRQRLKLRFTSGGREQSARRKSGRISSEIETDRVIREKLQDLMSQKR